MRATGNSNTAIKRALAVGLFVVWSSFAFAHSHLESSAPAAGEVVQYSIRNILLTFTKPISKEKSSVIIVAPVHFEMGEPEFGSNTITLPVNGALPPGTYRVEWKVANPPAMHETEGSYEFTVKGD